MDTSKCFEMVNFISAIYPDYTLKFNKYDISFTEQEAQTLRLECCPILNTVTIKPTEQKIIFISSSKYPYPPKPKWNKHNKKHKNK